MPRDTTIRSEAPARAPALHQGLDRLLILLFLVALAVPAVFLKPDQEAAAAEKRTLAPAPAIPRDLKTLAKFPDAFDAWFADHFGFRQLLIKTHARISFFLLRTSPSPKVIRGREGWLYYNGTAARDGDTLADFRGVPPLSFAALERWRWAFQDQHDWLTARGIHHLLALIPAKETIYPDNMPAHYTRLGSPTIEQVARHLRERTNIPIIDTTPALREASARVLTYHPNDTHWNAFGAYIGYREIMDKVAEIYPQCAPRREEEFKREELVGTGGDLAVMANLGDIHPQRYVYMNPLFATNAVFTLLGDDDMAELITRTGNTNLPRAAILRDSFTEATRAYFAEHFDQAHFQWARTGFEASLLERVDPQIVLQIIADRAFRKPRRYPVMMHYESIARRFDAAATIEPVSAASLTPVGGTVIESVDGRTAIARDGKPPETEINVPAHHDRALPILQFTVVSDLHRDLISTWETVDRDQNGLTTRRAPPFQLQPGTNVFHLALVDPDITTPVRIQWGRHPGRIELLGVEMRSVPR